LSELVDRIILKKNYINMYVYNMKIEKVRLENAVGVLRYVIGYAVYDFFRISLFGPTSREKSRTRILLNVARNIELEKYISEKLGIT